MLRKTLNTLWKPLSGKLGNLLKPVSRLVETLPISTNSLTTVAWIVLCLLVLWICSGCTTQRAVKPTLPAQAEPRSLPSFHGRTYRDVMGYVIELREFGLSCESDKAVIRYVFKEQAP